MLKGGVIMDVTTADQAKIAEDAGACAVMALERVPADIRTRRRRRAHGRPTKVEEIMRGRHDPGDGQGPDRPLRRGADPAVARRRLHRRVRGPHARRRGAPHRQVGVHGAVRVRRAQPGRGAAAHRRGRGDDPHQGRGRAPATWSRPCVTCARSPRRSRAHRARPRRSWPRAAKELGAPLELVREVAATGTAAGRELLRRRHRPRRPTPR